MCVCVGGGGVRNVEAVHIKTEFNRILKYAVPVCGNGIWSRAL
jgi:hypothetical protein